MYSYSRPIHDECYCHVFVEDGPPCSWGSLLGEVSTSLKTLILLLSWWNYHLKCSNRMRVLLYGPCCSFYDANFGFPDWSMILNYVILLGVRYISTIYRMDMNVIYCSPESGNLMSCSVWMICSVTSMVCHGGFCNCGLSVLNGIHLSCFYSSFAHPLVVIWTGLCTSHNGWSCDVNYSDTVIWICLLSQSSWQCLQLDLVWWFSMPCDVVLVFCKGLFCEGSPWQHVHIHHIHDMWCEGSVVQCVLVLGIENISHPHWTSCRLLMTEWL